MIGLERTIACKYTSNPPVACDWWVNSDRLPVVIAVSGVFEPPSVSSQAFTGSKVYTYKDCLLESIVHAGLRVEVELEPLGRAIVVVVWD